ncbi:hypothetical protein CC2G_004931 [Coprinopsis cinerea AmutBmut pab1-1]|nr:hypothetical protein CC2G_004931 [Coprinopsis cinerea AmutBmut pab1-1]
MPVTAQQERITRTHGSTNLESGEFRASPPSEIVPGVQGGHVDTAPQQGKKRELTFTTSPLKQTDVHSSLYATWGWK